MSHFKSRLSLIVLLNVLQQSDQRQLWPCYDSDYTVHQRHLWNHRTYTTTLQYTCCTQTDINLLTNVRDKDSRAVYTLLISLGAILNFQQMTSFAERSYTWPKWLPKMKALLTLILQYVHVKKECVYLISRGIFSLCLYGYVIVTLKLSCKDIPWSVISRVNESWLKCQKQKCELKFWLNRRGLRQQTRAELLPGNLFYRPMVLILCIICEEIMYGQCWSENSFTLCQMQQSVRTLLLEINFLVRKRWVHETASSTGIHGSCRQSIEHKTQLQ